MKAYIIRYRDSDGFGQDYMEGRNVLHVARAYWKAHPFRYIVEVIEG